MKTVLIKINKRKNNILVYLKFIKKCLKELNKIDKKALLTFKL